MNHETNCKCTLHCSEVQQTLTELEFERGIWNAAIYNEINRIRYFVANGKTNDRDNFGYTALHYAARNGNEEICKILLKIGKADVNAVTNGGATPLHRAAMMGHLKVVQLLVEYNANLTIQDDDGQTALHRSAQKGFYFVSKYLVQHTSNLKIIKDKKEQTAFNVIPKFDFEYKSELTHLLLI